jgi:type VI secretion system secreted protein VgrG
VGGGKGMYFVPEVGEEVLVAFENRNPEKPYMQGAMYNRNESSGYSTSGNDKKVIHTRSGTKMILNDAEGSVFIEDPSGNTWHMDGKGNISVNAPKNMSITVGENLDISVGNNMSTSVGVNISTSAGANISEAAGVNKSETVGAIKNSFVGGDSMMNVGGKLTEIIEGDVHSETKKGENIVNAEKGMNFNSNGKIQKHSEKEVQVNAAEKSKLF